MTNVTPLREELLLPRHVLRFSNEAELRTTQLRWCGRCGLIAIAIDAFEREQLDRLGFTPRLCPGCSAELERVA
jgi:hypothetical protein